MALSSEEGLRDWVKTTFSELNKERRGKATTTFLDRAEDILRKGALSPTATDKPTGGVQLSATCWGSGSGASQYELYADLDAAGAVASQGCSCPFFKDGAAPSCKHLVAMLLWHVRQVHSSRAGPGAAMPAAAPPAAAAIPQRGAAAGSRQTDPMAQTASPIPDTDTDERQAQPRKRRLPASFSEAPQPPPSQSRAKTTEAAIPHEAEAAPAASSGPDAGGSGAAAPVVVRRRLVKQAAAAAAAVAAPSRAKPAAPPPATGRMPPEAMAAISDADLCAACEAALREATGAPTDQPAGASARSSLQAPKADPAGSRLQSGAAEPPLKPAQAATSGAAPGRAPAEVPAGAAGVAALPAEGSAVRPVSPEARVGAGGGAAAPVAAGSPGDRPKRRGMLRMLDDL
eukprot:jgi/Tetstr1/427357/TSEL_017524.t1